MLYADIIKIALAHFCDNHGPTSILCTQALPASCFSCSPPSRSTFSSFDDDHGLHPISPTKASSPIAPLPAASSTPVLSFSDVIESPTAFPANNAPSTKFTDSGPADRVATRTTRTPTSSGSSAQECINCSINLPAHLTDPHHSPPSTSSSTSNTGKFPTSPALRTRLPIRIFDDPESGYCSDESSPSRPSSPSNFPYSTSTSKFLYSASSPRHHYSSAHYLTPPTAPNSYTSAHTTSTTSSSPAQSYHEHQITYLSTHHPLSGGVYASLRRSIVRTLSGEVLPRGCTAGPIYFTTTSPASSPTSSLGNSKDDGGGGDEDETTSTIAWTFRLGDKHARGGYRVYSLIALAASAEPAHVYQLVAPIWRRFEDLTGWIAGMVEGEVRRMELAEAEAETVAGLELEEEEKEEEEGGELALGKKKQDRMKKEGGDRASDETVKGKAAGSAGTGGGERTSAGSFLTGGGGAKGERRGGSSYFGPGSSSQGGGGGGGIGIGGGARGVGAGLRGRGLVEMCGDTEVFARLHWSFVEMLKEFG